MQNYIEKYQISLKSAGTIAVVTHSSIKTKSTDNAESQSDEWASCEKDYFKTTGAPVNKNRNNNDTQKVDNTTGFKSQKDGKGRTFSSTQITESEPRPANLKPEYNQTLGGNF